LNAGSGEQPRGQREFQSQGEAMHVILTHEQADFDALGASLGAALLRPGAVPILPRRINTNARAFMAAHGSNLPFQDVGALGSGPIERVTLVDTQSLVSIKGLSLTTQVEVFDHHRASPKLNPVWETHIEPVGATVTLLVEALKAQSSSLNQAAATLLLLGLYEDTGLLSYSITTARDLQAGAWLLEHGADLKLAADYLDHPLSPEQQALFERLMEASETLIYHGVPVVVATARAEGMQDEISALAGKLRNTFDAAGLVLLVALNSHIQLVARSTSDAVDVARVAEHFGGGGHNRAAAALIRNKDLETARQEVMALLESVIAPPRTVGEIMSRAPRVMHAESLIDDAARQMQRSGHEGYPVVKGDRIVGLLTRRAVDRAVAHELGRRPVSSIMEAGQISVAPGDSLEHLQQVMTSHDWGQVPVVDRPGGQIVGIVTRTDVLKTLAADKVASGPTNLADRLAAVLSPGRLRLLRLVAEQAEQGGSALYVVGGFVRDLLLGQPSVDFDLVVEGDALTLAEALAQRFGGRVRGHRRFGTAKWLIDQTHLGLVQAIDESETGQAALPASLDLVGARTEFYLHPSALPTVERGSIKLDLHRRDFTINTLALRLDGRHYGELQDDWGGGADLKQGLIRVLHSLSFVDDPTRMLRAVRLGQRLGFQIESRTLELLKSATPLLDRVSGDRVRSELALAFGEERRVDILRQLHELGLLGAIHPDLAWDDWLEARWPLVSGFQPTDVGGLEQVPDQESLFFTVWLYRLEAASAQGVANRLTFPGWMERQAIAAGQAGRTLGGLLAEADRAIIRGWIREYLEDWRHVRAGIDGDALRERGIPPGPAYSLILSRLRDAWLDGGIVTPQDELALLDDVLEEMNAGG
jgi:tRNA nucleotidyltransferase (CCA-adding enzyme)